MNDECKNSQCACEEEENFFHVKVIPQNSAKLSAAVEEAFSTYEFESNSLLNKDSMGRDKFWSEDGNK